MKRSLKQKIRYEWNYIGRIKLTPKGLWVLLLVLRDSLKWCFSINIGNYLLHENKKVLVNNGVKVDYWDCLECDDDFNIIRPDGNLAINVLVPKNNAKKIYTFKTPLSDFMQGFRFYMGYWYLIWVSPNSGDYGLYKNRPSKIR